MEFAIKGETEEMSRAGSLQELLEEVPVGLY